MNCLESSITISEFGMLFTLSTIAKVNVLEAPGIIEEVVKEAEKEVVAKNKFFINKLKENYL